MFYAITGTLSILFLAPLVEGLIKKCKAYLQNRRGSPVLQPYYDLWKYWSKSSVVSPTTSWIFHAAPLLYFAAVFAAAGMVAAGGAGFRSVDMLLLIYVFAFGRFWLALASLDAGSSFGGMGGSREMYVSVLVEPALILAFLTVALRAGTTRLADMAAAAAASPFALSYLLAAIAFFIITIAETGRIPVDNPDTHLELTMIHEGMILEYSGRYLGLIYWASMVKQAVVLVLFVLLFLPWGAAFFAGTPGAPAVLMLKVILTAILLAVVETGNAKMRLFRLPGFLAVSCLLSLLALVVW
ncbi:nadh:ubiquinone oxidoreductase subunit 1/f420h2 oxidoreductase subunit h [Lucifera butyrica]|uniref:Nadh:ubiquinone oxidoreductase subunit 1/f420h2 oxidoreductase subunit h n=1 Tax=Lucifera butyrica TaxID=1351585 RepID=A0A498R769_9FIRM|nr:NADH-quinone oxidoreductase subunit H [Lucifera butyrica]VBB06770.1 nadh:ubiquinone oxidoreductase subunit 1/f420h2 oxidoreductase subunit h [Lucifera butyrica]